jgi:YVTN family beta-propeller protein
MKKLLFFLPLILYAQVIDTAIYFLDEPFELLYISDGNELYINFRRNNYFLVLDCSTYTIKTTISRPCGYEGSAYGIWNERRNKIYYSFNPQPDSIAVIDNRTDSIIKLINYEGRFPLCYNSKDDKLYATNGTSVAVIDCATDSIIKIITQPHFLSGFVLWDSIGNKVYCGGGWASDKVTVINCANDSVIAVISTGVSTPSAAVYNYRLRKVYVAGSWGLRGAVIDGIGDTLIKNLNVDYRDYTEIPLLWNSLEDKVYWPGYDWLYVIDCQSDSIIKNLRILSWCMRLGSWSNRLYAPADSIINNQRVNVLKVLDCHNDSIISLMIFGKAAIAMTCDHQNHRIFISTQGDSALYVIRDEIPGIEERQTLDAKRYTPEIYPNPAKSVVRVRGPLIVKEVGEIKIFDASGKLVKEERITSAQEYKQEMKISLKGIEPGIYFLRLGKETKKFLVVK